MEIGKMKKITFISGSELPSKINFKNSDSELKFELNVNWIL